MCSWLMQYVRYPLGYSCVSTAMSREIEVVICDDDSVELSEWMTFEYFFRLPPKPFPTGHPFISL